MNNKLLFKLNPVALILIATAIFSINQLKAETVNNPEKEFNLNISFVDNLKNQKGKLVTVHMASGEYLEGIIKDVNLEMLHLEKITGKEYFDSLIVVSEISSITMRYR